MRTLTLLLLLALPFIGTSQITADSCKRSDLLDSLAFNKIVRNQFTNIISGEAKAQVGNFATLDIKEGKVSFNGSKKFKNASVLSINASGGIDDGLFSIFSNSKLNSSIGLEVKYSFLNRYNRHLSYLCSTIRSANDAIADIGETYTIKKRLIQQDARLTSLYEEQATKKIQALNNKLEQLLNSHSADMATSDNILSTRIELEAAKARLDSMRLKTATIYKDSLRVALKQLAVEKKDLSKKAMDAFEVTGFNINWFSISYKINSKSFKLYDSKLAFDDQVQKKQYVSHQVKLEWNLYKWSSTAFESHYLQLGAGFSIDDNKDKLTETELNDKITSASGAVERSITDKYKVYTGDYAKDLLKLRLSADYYYFLFENNIAAFHIFPDAAYQKDEKPVYNAGIGFMYSFKSEKDEKTNINAELYYQATDLFNSAGDTKKLQERNEAGLRFSFPISFIIK